MWRGRGRPDLRKQLFGGEGSVAVWDLADGDPLAPPFHAALGCVLKPASSVGPHVQEHCSELVIVTEGTGLARVGGASTRLKPGTVVSVPLGATLELANRSRTAPLRYLIIKSAHST